MRSLSTSGFQEANILSLRLYKTAANESKPKWHLSSLIDKLSDSQAGVMLSLYGDKV